MCPTSYPKDSSQSNTKSSTYLVEPAIGHQTKPTLFFVKSRLFQVDHSFYLEKIFYFLFSFSLSTLVSEKRITIRSRYVCDNFSTFLHLIKWEEWRTTKNIGVNEVLSFIKVKNLVLKTRNGLKFFSSGRWCAVKMEKEKSKSKVP